MHNFVLFFLRLRFGDDEEDIYDDDEEDDDY